MSESTLRARPADPAQTVFTTEGPASSLDRLGMGATARVAAVIGPPRLRRRLLEMGLCRGVTITAVRRAPLGDPVEYRLRGYFLSLRADQAACVVVEEATP